MSVELKVPAVGESINEVQIAQWFRNEGDTVQRDEKLVEIETDKATVEVSAPGPGRLIKVLKPAGEAATVGEVIGYLEELNDAGTAPSAPASTPPAAATAPAATPMSSAAPPRGPDQGKAGPDHAAGPLTGGPLSGTAQPQNGGASGPIVMPAARRELAAQGLKPEEVAATGPGGRVLKEDVTRQAALKPATPPAAPAKPAAAPTAAVATVPAKAPAKAAVVPTVVSSGGREIEAVKMTPLRKRIAERLVEAQHSAALLTTFNEIDMQGVMALRAEHKEKFQEKHGVKLGFTSFFVKAVIEALKAIPQLNASIDGDHIIYHNYFDIGIAVSSAKGLLVPVLRNAERMSFADIEQTVEDFGRRARENKIKLEELEGGTFTISNGGVFGSLLSTPIINPPQSGILGLHAIQDRPVARDGQVVIRPMMYVALSYDHRIVDGREAVTFLRRIKDGIEEPARLLLEI
jgi:2-oxoglutarate dehydrogenase E2 component (dihydrolipoamide succinyltransferase)